MKWGDMGCMGDMGDMTCALRDPIRSNRVTPFHYVSFIDLSLGHCVKGDRGKGHSYRVLHKRSEEDSNCASTVTPPSDN
jgi:hypothetical protein